MMAFDPTDEFDISNFDLQHHIDATRSYEVCIWKVTHGDPASAKGDPDNISYVLAVSPEHAIAIRNWLSKEMTPGHPEGILSVELVSASPCIDPRFDIQFGYVQSGQIERRVKRNAK